MMGTIVRRQANGTNKREPVNEPAAVKQAPFNLGDVVSLKSGGFSMTVMECVHIQACSDPEGCWATNVVFAPQEAGKEGLLYEEIDAALLKHAFDDSDFPF